MREQTLDQPKDSEPPPRQHKRIHLLQELARTPAQVARRLDRMPPDSLKLQPAPTAWSAQMVIAHLVRLEALYLDRLRRILQEQHPTLQKFGPEHAPPFSRLTARDLLAGFKRQRVQTLVFLRSLGLCGWHRTAEHETLGETDLQRQVQVFIQHDTAHLGQLHDLQSLCGQESLRPPIKRRVQGFKVKTEMDIKE